jgi:hypothetical protein
MACTAVSIGCGQQCLARKLEHAEAQRASIGFAQVDGQVRDHGTYLVPLGSADIFFPTDFALLERMYDSVARSHVPGFAGGEGLSPGMPYVSH